MRTLLTLGTDDGVGSLIGKPMSVNIDSRGRYWVFQEVEPPTVFHADGSVDRVIGRKGSGPGEFRSGDRGIVVGDSMLVFDWLESRATMVGPDLKPGRIIRLRARVGDILSLRWPSLLVTQGHTADARPANSELHFLTIDGGEIRRLSSFGPQGVGGPLGNVEVGQRLGEARAGFWTAYWNRPHVTKWNQDGTPNAVFIRRYSWFTGETRATHGTPTTPPTSITGPLRENDEGLLWLFIHTPAPTWSEAWDFPPTRYPGGGTEYSARKVGYDKLFRTYVEVIDPAQARRGSPFVQRLRFRDITGSSSRALPRGCGWHSPRGYCPAVADGPLMNESDLHCTFETILQHTQGQNPPGFDYRFNLHFGRRYTESPELLAKLRQIRDDETEARAIAGDREVRH